MTALVAALAGLTMWLLVPGSALSAGRDRMPRIPLPVVLGAGVGAFWWLLDGRAVVLAALGLGAVAASARAVARTRAGKAADRRAEQVLLACEAMATDLAAGQAPVRVLDRAAADWPELAPLATAGRLGADVPEVLRGLARRPGAGALRSVAAAWQVAHTSGAGLAHALELAADGIREQRRTRRLVAAELAAAHATARMMAALPVAVLLLGAGVGGDPVGFLTSTPVGLGCLGTGLALSFAGLFWLQSIADGVLRR